MSVDWDEINSKLPFARTKVIISVHNIIIMEKMQEDYAARKELWEAVDVNGNGFLSLAEVTKVVIVIVTMIIILAILNCHHCHCH